MPWSAAAKRRQLRLAGMRHALLWRAGEAAPCAFASFMASTAEEGDATSEPVIYLYELHVEPARQGAGHGSALLAHVEAAARAAAIPRVMLTCFVGNGEAMRFYCGRHAYALDASSAPLSAAPEYVILSKALLDDVFMV